MPDFRFQTGAATTSGRRPTNQDAFRCAGSWFVVADGAGGRESGGLAARLAVDTFDGQPPPDSIDAISSTVVRAHERIVRSAHEQSATDMFATIVGIAPVSARLGVFHVGDSRCYRFADGELKLLTTDHSLVQELISIGRLRAEEAPTHPHRHVVSRALGIDGAAESETAVIDMRPMRLLLCTDGISNTLSPVSLGRVLAGCAAPQQAAERLVELAAAGSDNATAVVVDVIDVSSEQQPVPGGG